MKDDSKTPTAASADEIPRWKTVLFSTALIAVSLTLSAIFLLVLEVAVRLNRGMLFSTAKVVPEASAPQGVDGLTRQPIAVHDPFLGHIPTPNLPGVKIAYERTVTTDAEGVRQNGSGPRPPGASILAAGDSFTFGLEVDDNESWPAHLERLLGRPVLNGGVFGYGFDQIVLRSEKILEAREDVDLVILAVFGDDIERSEYSYRFASKPYFQVRHGGLNLRNVPVPDGHTPVRLALLRNVLQYSHLADVLLTRAAPNWWLIKGRERHEHDQGAEVAALLLERWSAFAHQRDLQTLFVALLAWPEDTAQLQTLSNHAERVGLEVLDLSGLLLEMIQTDRERWQAPAGHLTNEGNKWVAAQIAARIQSTETHQTD